MIDLDELIAEARQHVPYAGSLDDNWCIHCADEWPCVTRRLADALEAAEKEIDRIDYHRGHWKDGFEDATAAIDRAREIHKPESNGRYTWCVGCSTDEYSEDWPCSTAAALGVNEGEER